MQVMSNQSKSTFEHMLGLNQLVSILLSSRYPTVENVYFSSSLIRFQSKTFSTHSALVPSPAHPRGKPVEHGNIVVSLVPCDETPAPHLRRGEATNVHHPIGPVVAENREIV